MVRDTPIRLMLAALVVAVAAFEVPHARAQEQDAAQAAGRDEQPTSKLKAERNLVVVRVVVRDSKGDVVSNLRKEDFGLFDNGQPQTISHFSVETSASQSALASEPEGPARRDSSGPRPEATPSPTAPRRYLAVYFDDLHMSNDDIIRSRDAATRFLESALQSGDRAGIFTSSGQHQLDFTDDRAKLREALSQIRRRSVAGPQTDPCSDISDYQAYLIAEQHDRFALEIATQEFLQCRYGERGGGGGGGGGRGAAGAASHFLQLASRDAQSEALKILRTTEIESRHVLRGLERLAQRMALLPGQRNIVLVSGGFLAQSLTYELDGVVDRALRLNVVISALDSRGLYVVIAGEREDGKTLPVEYSGEQRAQKEEIEMSRQRLASQTMESLAASTGGVFFNNNNDLFQGFRKVAGLAETFYVLAFSPQKLKPDGSFHTLKVRLASGQGLTVQARRGYFAPRKAADAAKQEEEEIREASLSRDELNDLPLDVQTQFFKPNSKSAKLSVMTRVDARQLQFRKEEGQHADDLIFVAVLYNRDGKYVTGERKVVKLRLSGATLEKVLQSGVALESRFDVAPGTYLVREVVRETGSGQMSALSRTVEIPD